MPMTKGEIFEALAPHSHRRISQFIRKPGSERADDAFWLAIYNGRFLSVDHETARAVSAELETTDRKVQDVLDGWRPGPLQQQENAA